MSINTIGVVGAGTMGLGIAQLFALNDYPVILIDTEKEILNSALERLKQYTKTESSKKVVTLITTTTDFGSAKECDLVIEAVYEDESVKKRVFQTLSNVCKKSVIYASNTSAISINKLATYVPNPVNFIGMHFMNPPKVMKLVEIIRGSLTSDKIVDIIRDLAKSLGKIPVIVNDSPGFVSNRLLFALIGEAFNLLENGIANKEDIDNVMQFGINHPVGPIKLADLIGLDTCKNIMSVLYNDLHDERYKPPHILESLVRKGKLGKKTGEGFYKYV